MVVCPVSQGSPRNEMTSGGWSGRHDRRRRLFLDVVAVLVALMICRFMAAPACPRAAPIQAFAALRNMLIAGFFFNHGFLIVPLSLHLKVNVFTSSDPRWPRRVAAQSALGSINRSRWQNADL